MIGLYEVILVPSPLVEYTLGLGFPIQVFSE